MLSPPLSCICLFFIGRVVWHYNMLPSSNHAFHSSRQASSCMHDSYLTCTLLYDQPYKEVVQVAFHYSFLPVSCNPIVRAHHLQPFTSGTNPLAGGSPLLIPFSSHFVRHVSIFPSFPVSWHLSRILAMALSGSLSSATPHSLERAQYTHHTTTTTYPDNQ
jgi:hypothetical protein